MIKIRKHIFSFVSSILNSYTQIFFSKNIGFAIILILVSFFDWFVGLSGVICVVSTNILAFVIGFDKKNIKDGLYGFNSLLVGFALGVYFNPGLSFFVLLLFSSLLTLMISIVLQGVLGKYGLPYLSLPFLFAIWIISLATREISSLEISERGVFVMNEMFAIGGMGMLKAHISLSQINLPEPLILYFKSLAAIFFQHHLLAGIIISMGLLIHSRISFILSILGFFAAYFYYNLMGVNIFELSHGFIGFNYILTAIAIGGYSTIPSKFSMLWVIILTPINSILITSTSALLATYQLSIYSLAFNIVVIMFLYVMKFRFTGLTYPEMTIYQFNSPEKNLYNHVNNTERFSQHVYKPIYLPFFGEWRVSQAHNGEFTHKLDWRHAWDFVITDDESKTYHWLGREKEDYYCFNKPIIAPADGIVEIIEDGIEDNIIGEVNTEKNWGNSIVIKHDAFLYSKLCHLKKGSFKVAIGSFVKKGEVIASCGNSGRSPEPHLHFQLQANPHIGSKTLDFPLAHYIQKNKDTFALKSYSKPNANDSISNVQLNLGLQNIYKFIPGQKIKVSRSSSDGHMNYKEEWEVLVDMYNKTYISCKKNHSKAYFINDGNLNYFTHYEGTRKNLLYYFFLANYKVLMSFYPKLCLIDSMPLNLISKNPIIYLQDLVAPFFLFLKADYKLTYSDADDSLNQENVKLNSECSFLLWNRSLKRFVFDINITKCNNILIKVNNGSNNFDMICELN